MKLPDRIKIGPHHFDIYDDYRFKERTDVNGQCDMCLQEIRISAVDGGGNVYSNERKRTIFLHEMLHGIQNAFLGNQDIAETLIEGFAVGIHSILVDNPQLFAQLMSNGESTQVKK